MKHRKEILLVSGMSGAGKSTVLRTLEDLGWEVVDQLPVLLINRLLATEPPEGVETDDKPLAVGLSTRTRGFDPAGLVRRIEKLREVNGYDTGLLFLDCGDAELERRYSETRRRHPLAADRPARDGIARERETLAPLRGWANRLIDTTNLASNELAQEIRDTFATREMRDPTLSVMSFGYARGLPRGADLVFDMRFLRNPHWDPELRPGTGQDRDVVDYISADPAYEQAMAQIESLVLLLLPRYREQGKSYVTIALGCTGGRHRSVHVAERISARLRSEGFSPTVRHRDLGAVPQDSLEGTPARV